MFLFLLLQPSMEIFEAFSNLVLLQRGGRLSYFGPLGVESSALTTFLEAQPGVEPIRAGYNPATWCVASAAAVCTAGLFSVQLQRQRSWLGWVVSPQDARGHGWQHKYHIQEL